MRILKTQFKKVIKCKVLATNGEVKIKFPKQLIGFVALQFENGIKNIILKQWDVYLNGDNLQIERVK